MLWAISDYIEEKVGMEQFFNANLLSWPDDIPEDALIEVDPKLGCLDQLKNLGFEPGRIYNGEQADKIKDYLVGLDLVLVNLAKLENHHRESYEQFKPNAFRISSVGLNIDTLLERYLMQDSLRKKHLGSEWLDFKSLIITDDNRQSDVKAIVQQLSGYDTIQRWHQYAQRQATKILQGKQVNVGFYYANTK